MAGILTFEEELSALLPRLRRFAHALSRNSADADDLTQMTIERALRSKDQWRPGTHLHSWACTIMRNLWIDTVRSRSRKEAFEAPAVEVEKVADGGGSLEASVELNRVMAAMQKLPEEQREIVALILVEGFGYREASEMLQLPIGTVSSRLVRGRTALLEILGE
jgi:RNA polymerase sigma-70 factor (ECF subfamily)